MSDYYRLTPKGRCRTDNTVVYNAENILRAKFQDYIFTYQQMETALLKDADLRGRNPMSIIDSMLRRQSIAFVGTAVGY